MAKKRSSSRRSKAEKKTSQRMSFEEFKRKRGERTRQLQEALGEKIKRFELKPAEAKHLQALKQRKELGLEDKLERDELLLRDRLAKMPQALMKAGVENQEIIRRVAAAEKKFNELKENAKEFLKAEGESVKEFQRSGQGRLVAEREQLKQAKNLLERGGEPGQNLRDLRARAELARRREQSLAKPVEQANAALEVARMALTRAQLDLKKEENYFDRLKLEPRTPAVASRLKAVEARLRQLTSKSRELKDSFKAAQTKANAVQREHAEAVAELNRANETIAAVQERVKGIDAKISEADRKLEQFSGRDKLKWHKLAVKRKGLLDEFWDLVYSD